MILKSSGWSETAKHGLERIIAAGPDGNRAAVFDFDNTIICGDIGEAAMAMLASEGMLRTDRVSEWLAPPFMSRRGTTVRLDRCPDVTAYYEELLDATWRDRDDRAPLSSGYIWAAAIMMGLGPLDVVRATGRVIAMSEPFVEKLIEASPGGNSYPVPFFYPQMTELIALLLKNRFEVWIVSASNVWSVRWMVLKALNPLLASMGCEGEIRPDRVIGLSMLLSDREGRLHKDPFLVRADRNYAGMEERSLANLTITGLTAHPAPVYSGKVANIMDFVGSRPILAAGDSPGDLPMLAFSEHRLWIARLEKSGYQKEFAAIASREKEDWMVQPVLHGDNRGFIGHTENCAELFSGAVPETVAESAEAIEPFLHIGR